MTFSSGKEPEDKTENILFILVELLKKRWKNLKDYQNAKKKIVPKRLKRTTGNGRTSEDDEMEDERDDDEADTNIEFLDSCPTQRFSFGNIIEEEQLVNDESIEREIILQSDIGEGSASGIVFEVLGDSESMQSIPSSSASPCPVTPKPNKRRKHPKEQDDYVSIMKEKTSILKDLANSSKTLSNAPNEDIKEKTVIEKYFDAYLADIALVPVVLQSKCQREVHQAITAVINKYQDEAEDMRN